MIKDVCGCDIRPRVKRFTCLDFKSPAIIDKAPLTLSDDGTLNCSNFCIHRQKVGLPPGNASALRKAGCESVPQPGQLADAVSSSPIQPKH